MLSLSECLTDETKIYLVKPEEKKERKWLNIKNRRNKEKRILRRDFNHADLIGVELCDMRSHVRNLRCSRFFLIGEGYYSVNHGARYKDIEGKGYQLKLGSYDYRDPDNYEYFKIDYDPQKRNQEYLDDVLAMAPTEENRAQLLDDIEELFALDTFMGQTDRYWNTVVFERNKETKEVRLAPISHFEHSLKTSEQDRNQIYGNVLHNFKTEQDYIDFIKEHPEFADKLRFYLGVDLIDAIKRAYRLQGLELPESVVPFYKQMEDDRKVLIKRVTGTK